jgi:hypothetical protein
MFRQLLVLVAVTVSACASSTPGVRTSASSGSPRDQASEHRSASAAPNDHGARLAPPFGGTAGVRRISNAKDANSDTSPDIVAAADRRDE